jgi:hypothetical protein
MQKYKKLKKTKKLWEKNMKIRWEGKSNNKEKTLNKLKRKNKLKEKNKRFNITKKWNYNKIKWSYKEIRLKKDKTEFRTIKSRKKK